MPAVYTDRVGDKQKITWLLPNVDYAYRLQELLESEAAVPCEIVELKNFQARVNALYPKSRQSYVQFACYVFEQRCIRHLVMEDELMGPRRRHAFR